MTTTNADVAEGKADRSARLLELAKARFGDLSPAETKLFQQTANGEVAYFGEGDPAEAATWGKDRVLQADRIRWLCTDPEAVKEMLPHEGVRIIGARIEGQLRLSYAEIEFALLIKNSAIPDGIVIQRAHIAALFLPGTHTGPITADGLRVDHALFMDGGFDAKGEVRLLGATIGGDLACVDGHFSNRDGCALNADRIKVEGGVFLNKGFEANGEVRLLGATIGGTLDGEKGHFSNPDGKALSADRIKVEGSVFLRDGFKAEGEVRVLGATIGGSLSCVHGHFSNPDGHALSADGINVQGSVFLREGFKAKGVVDFTASTIRGYFIWREVDAPKECTLNLESARIGTLWDEEASWPEQLHLDGLVYDRLYKEAPTDAEARLRWIALQKSDRFLPQPYQQLAKVLKDMGHEAEARKILIARAKDPARRKAMTRPQRAWHHLLAVTIGYGYRPWLAVWWMLGFLLAGSVLFGLAARGDQPKMMLLTQETTCPEFNVLVYSLDTFVPLIDLHQAKYRLPTGWYFRTYLWAHIMAGWVLTTLLVVGLTGLVQKLE